MTIAHAATDAHALVALLTLSEWNTEVGREVVDALAAMGPRAVPALVDALDARDGARLTRLAAVWLLARADVPQAYAALCQARRDADPDVAAAAGRALAGHAPAPCDGALAA